MLESARRKGLAVLFAGLCLVSAIFIAGCKKNDNNPVSSSSTVSDDVSDAANSVSDALASNNGGAMDQVNDVFEIAGGVGIGGGVLGKTDGAPAMTGAVYDTASKSWTMMLVKGDSALLPLYYGYWTRNYWLQFRAGGQPQKFRITNGILADTILHSLTSGTGYFWTPRLVHHLLSIGSSWSATRSTSDTSMISVNGTYFRSGVDTMYVIGTRTPNGRVLQDSLALTFQNVTGPRGARYARSEKTSGTIVVYFHAVVTAKNGTTHTVTETFTITLSNGYAEFTIGGTGFKADLGSGDH